MKTKSEIAADALGACPYAKRYNGHLPWMEGYVEAATAYESQLERLRNVLRDVEERANRGIEPSSHTLPKPRDGTPKSTPNAVVFTDTDGTDIVLGSGGAESPIRTPDGHINNCAVANGHPEGSCQICEGNCPDLSPEGLP